VGRGLSDSQDLVLYTFDIILLDLSVRLSGSIITFRLPPCSPRLLVPRLGIGTLVRSIAPCALPSPSRRCDPKLHPLQILARQFRARDPMDSIAAALLKRASARCAPRRSIHSLFVSLYVWMQQTPAETVLGAHIHSFTHSQPIRSTCVGVKQTTKIRWGRSVVLRLSTFILSDRDNCICVRISSLARSLPPTSSTLFCGLARPIEADTAVK
jgi:hypothetical protein